MISLTGPTHLTSLPAFIPLASSSQLILAVIASSIIARLTLIKRRLRDHLMLLFRLESFRLGVHQHTARQPRDMRILLTGSFQLELTPPLSLHVIKPLMQTKARANFVLRK